MSFTNFKSAWRLVMALVPLVATRASSSVLTPAPTKPVTRWSRARHRGCSELHARRPSRELLRPLFVRGGGRYDDQSNYYYDPNDGGDDGDYYQDDGRYNDPRYGYGQPNPPQQQPVPGRGDESDNEGWGGAGGGIDNPLQGIGALGGLGGLGGGNRRIGLMMVGGGSLVTIMGVTLFFNKMLISLGNLLFISGMPLLVGPGKTVAYFTAPKRLRATATFGFGAFLVFIGWPFFGLLIEAFGLLNLFGNMFPLLWAMVKRMPFVSSLLSGSPEREEAGYGYE